MTSAFEVDEIDGVDNNNNRGRDKVRSYPRIIGMQKIKIRSPLPEKFDACGTVFSFMSNSIQIHSN